MAVGKGSGGPGRKSGGSGKRIGGPRPPRGMRGGPGMPPPPPRPRPPRHYYGPRRHSYSEGGYPRRSCLSYLLAIAIIIAVLAMAFYFLR